ncbi:hypothetical protein [Anabaena catenula]|uniref:Glutaredoxin domain-containing protein n=1 Tax=Anabaena catenula FACHB-362 TaxID=2692877 RepID=A0ABR8IZI3_9NOST|nr:hypothetical protein [Anabaena catenula]MBD2691019.1 hypothetical protein [Anabaena catenula FACHB-362]
MKSLKNIAFVFAVLFSTVTTSSIAVAAKNHQQANLATRNRKTVTKVKIIKKNAVKKAVKKSPLILVFGRDTCSRTTYMRQQLGTNKIAFKYRNVDDPVVNNQMWNLLRRYELKSNYVSLPVVYVKGNVFLNPTLGDVKSKI